MKKAQFEKIMPEYEGQKTKKSFFAIGAFVRDNILAVDFYVEKDKVWKASWRTLINAKEFCNFDHTLKCWDGRKIGSVIDEKGWHGYSPHTYRKNVGYQLLGNAKEIIDKFVKSLSGSIYKDAIDTLYYKENALAEESRQTAEERRFQRIQDKMRDIPDLPKDFKRFINDKVFKNDHFMYYNKESAYCTRCGISTGKTKDMKHNTFGRCPACKKYVRYKSVGRMPEHDERKEVLLIQKYEDDVILRYFNCSLKSEYGHRESLQYSESVRTYHDKKIEWYSKRYVQYVDWLGHEYWSDKMNSYHQIVYGIKTVLYSGNLEEIADLHDTIRYMPIKELAEEGITLPWKNILRGQALKNEIFEKLYKAGLKQLAIEYMHSNMTTNYTEHDLRKLLMITKPMFEYMREHDSGKKVLEVFQDAKKDNCGLNDTEIFELAEAGITVSELKEVASGSRLIKLLHYLQKVKGYSKLKITYSHYVDYIGMAKEMDYNLENDIVRYPKDLRAAHDKAVSEFYQAEIDKKAREVMRKYPQIRKMAEELNAKYGYKDKNYVIVAPANAADIVAEGRKLHHCVGGDTYLSRHNCGSSFIFFLRKASEPEKSYYTIELSAKDNRIMQYYGYNDKKPDKEAVNAILEKWKRQLARRKEQIQVAG